MIILTSLPQSKEFKLGLKIIRRDEEKGHYDFYYDDHRTYKLRGEAPWMLVLYEDIPRGKEIPMPSVSAAMSWITSMYFIEIDHDMSRWLEKNKKK